MRNVDIHTDTEQYKWWGEVCSYPRSRRWETLSGEATWWWHSPWRKLAMNWELTFPVDGSATCWPDGDCDWWMCADSHLEQVCMQDEEVSFLNYVCTTEYKGKINNKQTWAHIYSCSSGATGTNVTVFVPFWLCSCVRWRSLMESTEWSSISVRSLSLIL